MDFTSYFALTYLLICWIDFLVGTIHASYFAFTATDLLDRKGEGVYNIIEVQKSSCCNQC